MGVNSPDKKMEKQERSEYIGSGMSGCLTPLPWEGEGQQQSIVLLRGYGGGGGQRLSQKDQGWKSLLCICSMPAGQASLDGNHRVTEGQGAHL